MKLKIPYKAAKEAVDEVIEQLRPHCIRIEIAGSISRECEFCGDIEIVAIPKPYDTGLFNSGIAAVVNKWSKVIGELEYGKTRYTKRILPNGMQLDLFFATENNWGLIKAIRTGPAEYSHTVLAAGWAARGYKSINGMLTYNGKEYNIKEEIDLFNRIGIPWTEPKNRL